MTVTSTVPTSRGRTKASRGRTGRRRAPGPAAPQICPYLIAEDGAWRSARPSREHRCGAVTPAAPLALDKQRRLCLAKAHESCATRLVAVSQSVEGFPEDQFIDRPASAPRAGAVTRWSIVRTAPVVLDAGEAGSVSSRSRRRPVAQLALGGVMALALGAVLLTRPPEPTAPGVPAVLSATGRPSAAPASPERPSRAPVASVAPAIGPVAASSPSPRPTNPGSALPSTQVGTAPALYHVRAGDTLYALASRFGTTVVALQELNGLGDSTLLQIGQELRLR